MLIGDRVKPWREAAAADPPDGWDANRRTNGPVSASVTKQTRRKDLIAITPSWRRR